MSQFDSSTIKAIVDLAREGGGLKTAVVFDAAESIAGKRIFITHNTGTSVSDVTDLVVQALPNPPSRRGVVELTTATSFTSFTNRYSLPNSVIFATPGDAPKLTAIFDYHDAVNPLDDTPDDPSVGGATVDSDGAAREPLPQWGKFRAYYAFPLSRQYKIWSGANGRVVTQAELASFIEANILDILDPNSFDDPATTDLISQLGLKVASRSTLLETARGLQIKSTETVTTAVNLNTGEAAIGYTEIHEGGSANGQTRVVIPTAFLIGLQIFEGGDAYRLLVRLRYVKRDNKLAWSFEIFQIDKAVRDAFTRESTEVGNNTGLPVFFGHAPPV